MEVNFKEQGMQLMIAKEKEARLIVSEQGNLMLNVNSQNNVKLICYLRERRRIIDLVNVLEKKAILI